MRLNYNLKIIVKDIFTNAIHVPLSNSKRLPCISHRHFNNIQFSRQNIDVHTKFCVQQSTVTQIQSKETRIKNLKIQL